jgi:KDO2-lipid IV(A) lauroyltransferase
MKHLKDSLVAFAYLLAWKIVRWLPEKKAYGLFYALGRKLEQRQGKSVLRLRSNLRHVQPTISERELDELLSRAMKSYLRYWCDTFRFPDWSVDRIRSTVELKDGHLLIDALESNTGVIVALPHAGNWDHAGAYFCGKGAKLVTVAERLKPEALFKRFLEYREAIGMEVLALDGRVIATLAQRLRKGGLVALVADRDLSKTGISVNFFDGIARMPAGPALLALNTGSPLLTAYVSYTPTGIHIEFRFVEIPTEGSQQEKVLAIVQKCADNFADGIAAHPEDWHMMQRIWIDADFKERPDVE